MEYAIEVINKYGFPIVAAGGMGYFVYFIWLWTANDIKPQISKAHDELIALIDRVRMLDNDLIRLNEKVNVVLYLRRLTPTYDQPPDTSESNKE
jgi:hypothetical protein